VYRGWDLHTGRAVAGKLYQAGAVSGGRAPHRAEVVALAMLRHPGPVQLYDAGRCDLVMQLVEGETLARRIGTGPLPEAAVAAVGADLADPLAGAHERGIVHRDLKPANVLLDRHDRPHLTDFGVARHMAATHSTATDVVLGTPAFLAPEQVTGQPVRGQPVRGQPVRGRPPTSTRSGWCCGKRSAVTGSTRAARSSPPWPGCGGPHGCPSSCPPSYASCCAR
jgi:serine/threonine protein kinase